MKTNHKQKKTHPKKSQKRRLIWGLFGSWSIAGLAIGAALGYVFYATIGCRIEACSFISNPFITVAWGALLVFVVFEVFRIISIDDVG